MKPLTTFAVLQLADGLSTIAFLAAGVEEANPLIRALLQSCAPGVALLIIKLAAMLLAMVCIASGRAMLLRRVNIGFAALVVWNVVATVVV
jgi:hypothetical protein